MPKVQLCCLQSKIMEDRLTLKLQTLFRQFFWVLPDISMSHSSIPSPCNDLELMQRIWGWLYLEKCLFLPNEFANKKHACIRESWETFHWSLTNLELLFSDLCVINIAGFLNTGYKGVLFYFKRHLSRVPGSARLVWMGPWWKEQTAQKTITDKKWKTKYSKRIGGSI